MAVVFEHVFDNIALRARARIVQNNNARGILIVVKWAVTDLCADQFGRSQSAHVTLRVMEPKRVYYYRTLRVRTHFSFVTTYTIYYYYYYYYYTRRARKPSTSPPPRTAPRPFASRRLPGGRRRIRTKYVAIKWLSTDDVIPRYRPNSVTALCAPVCTVILLFHACCKSVTWRSVEVRYGPKCAGERLPWEKLPRRRLNRMYRRRRRRRRLFHYKILRRRQQQQRQQQQR